MNGSVFKMKTKIDYSLFLKDKKVAVVGPSKSALFTKDNGNKIDSYDVVIRINQGLDLISLNKDSFGTKVDVLYNSLDYSPDSGGIINSQKLYQHGVNYICSPYAEYEGFHNPIIYSIDSYLKSSLYNHFSIRFIDRGLYDSIKHGANSRVNSGLGTIVDILSFDISELYITGIDFYRSSYFKGYTPSRNRNNTKKEIEEELEIYQYNDCLHHNPDRQYMFFKDRLVANDKRIKLDSFMGKIIEDERYDKWETIPSEVNYETGNGNT